jgi:hypothetical protein
MDDSHWGALSSSMGKESLSRGLFRELNNGYRLHTQFPKAPRDPSLSHHHHCLLKSPARLWLVKISIQHPIQGLDVCPGVYTSALLLSCLAYLLCLSQELKIWNCGRIYLSEMGHECSNPGGSFANCFEFANVKPLHPVQLPMSLPPP